MDLKTRKLRSASLIAFGLLTGAAYAQTPTPPEAKPAEPAPPPPIFSIWGFDLTGHFDVGYTHLTGGYPGGQAEYLRVPFADAARQQPVCELVDRAGGFVPGDLPPLARLGLCQVGGARPVRRNGVAPELDDRSVIGWCH